MHSSPLNVQTLRVGIRRSDPVWMSPETISMQTRHLLYDRASCPVNYFSIIIIDIDTKNQHHILNIDL